MPKLLSQKEFLKIAKKVHGNKYDYSKTKYTNARKKISIICKKHGEFIQQPYVHLLKHGCPSCINKTEFKFYEKGSFAGTSFILGSKTL